MGTIEKRVGDEKVLVEKKERLSRQRAGRSSPVHPHFPAIIPTDREPGTGYSTTKKSLACTSQQLHRLLTLQNLITLTMASQ